MNGAIAASRRRGNVGVPTVPTGLLLQTFTLCQTTFTLQWTASSTPTGYKIYKNGTLYVDTGNTNTEYNITGQTAGTTNTWTVSAYNIVGESNQSAGLSVTQGVTVTLINNTSPNMTIGYATSAEACGGSLVFGHYKTGNSTPSNGAIIYVNECGTNKLNGGGSYYSDGSVSFTVSSDGVIGNFDICI